MVLFKRIELLGLLTATPRGGLDSRKSCLPAFTLQLESMLRSLQSGCSDLFMQHETGSIEQKP